MLVNVGGCKGCNKYSLSIREKWKTLDLNPSADVPHDLNSEKSIPLEDGVVTAYYASHVMEHVRMERQRHAWAELFRTLTPGGLIRIVVPDMDEGINYFRHRNETLRSDKRLPALHVSAPNTWLGYLLCWLYTPDRKHSSGHCMGYDFDTLASYLLISGFKHTRRQVYSQCSAVFDGLDLERYRGWCLYVEATKPL